MPEFPKPVVVVSQCLGFSACRWDGTSVVSEAVSRLCQWVECKPICAEVEIGLGTPRAPVRIIANGSQVALVQPETGIDYTADMRAFCDSCLAELGPVDGFILKSKSPSCGLRDTKIYQERGKSVLTAKGAGFLGSAVLSRYANVPIEDETRLEDIRLREHFYTRLFCQAHFRQVLAKGTMRELVHFHSEQKLLLMAYNQAALKRMNRIIANPDKRKTAEVMAEYASNYYAALAHPPRTTSVINVLMAALEYLSDKLSASEKAHFLEVLAQYRAGIMPLSECIKVLQTWATTFKQAGLQRQQFLHPFPAALAS